MKDIRFILCCVFIAIQVVASLHLLIPLFLVMIYSLDKVCTPGSSNITTNAQGKKYKFGIVVTAHKEIIFLPPLIDSILKQTYRNFEIYVVADQCDVTELNFKDSRVHILKPAEALNSNVLSIQYALDHFSEDIEVFTLFDPDNLIDHCFFYELNHFYNLGYKAVQANLYPKNLQGRYAKIDSIGLVFYNFVDREARALLGLSVNIWGCGISVMKDVYLKIIYDDKSTLGGFDKHMQAEIVKNIPLIGFARKAILYDEKISDSKNLVNQRTRWINSYFKFFTIGFDVFKAGFTRQNINLVYFGFNLLRPPYFLQILYSFFFLGINLFFFYPMFVYWSCSLILFFFSIICILILKDSKEIFKGLLYLPLFFYHQVRALMSLRINKRSNLKTEHFEVLYIEDMVRK